jgi:hypothetical protein
MPTLKAVTYEPIPAGTYKLRIVSCEIHENPKPQPGRNAEFLVWSFAILDREDLADKTVDIATSFSVSKNSKAIKFLKPSGMPDGTNTIESDDFIGCEFVGKVTVVDRSSSEGQKNELEAAWSLEEWARMTAPAKGVGKPVTLGKMAQKQQTAQQAAPAKAVAQAAHTTATASVIPDDVAAPPDDPTAFPA